MRIIPNQSEKHFVFRLIKNGQKSIRLNPLNSETSIRMNPKPSFQSRSIGINPIWDWSKPNFQSESIQIIPTLDSFRLILIENSVRINLGLVRIHSDSSLGINQIKSDIILTVFHQTRYKTFFGLVRNDSDLLGYRYRNKSE